MDWLWKLPAAAARLDADAALQGGMAALIELAATRYALDAGARWQPGAPLKLLLAGYSGTRNTGADVRVEEMVRQIRHLLGDDLADLSLLTIDPPGSSRYFKTVKQIALPPVFPRFLFDTVHRQHGVIACEGSMFKSKFANALSTLMVGALGLAGAERKVAVGYGGEAGTMDPSLERLVRRYCRDALVLTRNEASESILAALGVPTRPGTDTAWTFEPDHPAQGDVLLREAGWDGRLPVLVVCPINPFWWPVKPDLARTVARLTTGAHTEAHFSAVYFHNAGPEVDARQAAYIGALAAAVHRFRSRHPVFPVVLGMEALDRRATDQLREALGGDVPAFVADEHDIHPMVAILRRASLLVSSRYHAIVCSMSAQVPAVGITMDERIANLMGDQGTPELALTVDDPHLDDRLLEALERLHAEGDALRPGIGACVVRNLRRMGHMGGHFVDHLRGHHPDLPLRPELGASGDPWAHLPALSPALERLVRQQAAAA